MAASHNNYAMQVTTMPKFSRFPDLVEAGYVNNRMTLQRWIERGIFPPPVDLGPNTIAWAVEDLTEYDDRVRAGVSTPNPNWLAKLAERRTRLASRGSGRLSA